EVNVFMAERLGEFRLQVSAVNADARRAEFAVQVAEVGADEKPAAPRAQLALSDWCGHRLNGLTDAEFPQHLHRVRPEHEAGPYLTEFGSLLINGHVPARPLERNGRRQPADAGSDHHRPRHKLPPEHELMSHHRPTDPGFLSE